VLFQHDGCSLAAALKLGYGIPQPGQPPSTGPLTQKPYLSRGPGADADAAAPPGSRADDAMAAVSAHAITAETAILAPEVAPNHHRSPAMAPRAASRQPAASQPKPSPRQAPYRTPSNDTFVSCHPDSVFQ
jgi:hypothetical protein